MPHLTTERIYQRMEKHLADDHVLQVFEEVHDALTSRAWREGRR